MFGYIKANKPELKIKHYEQYRGIYCSLCKVLGKRYGLVARMTLNYDFTFFAIMKLCTKRESPCFKAGRCPFNLAKHCNFCLNCDREMEFCADIAMIMTYYKIKDNIKDEHIFKKILMFIILPIFTFYHNKAKKLCPQGEEIILEAMRKQEDIEIQQISDLDISSDATASMLGELLSIGEVDDKKAVMNRIGYCVGRWIYITDAYFDKEKDEKNNGYNPILLGKISDNEVETSLEMTRNQLENAYDLLEVKQFNSIIKNIISDSMKLIIASKKDKKEKKGNHNEKSL